ncbi:hypothetical protein ACFWPU_18135 [Streptomyces sp. NPDC058471]
MARRAPRGLLAPRTAGVVERGSRSAGRPGRITSTSTSPAKR